MARFPATALVLASVFSAAGCAGTTLTVTPSPAEAKVFLDGELKGTGPTDLELPEDERTYSLRVGALPGYFDHEQQVTTLSESSIGVELKADGSYAQTVDGEGQLNQWLVLPVAPHYDEDEAWHKVTRAIGVATSDFKDLKRQSFSLRTGWQVAGKKADWRRTASRIVVRPGSRKAGERSVRIMIESRLIDASLKKVKDADRTFKPLLDAVNMARDLLAR